MVRSTLDLIILHILNQEQSYGYEVSRRISDLSAGAYQVKETTLYAAIRRLEQKGFLESFAGSETAGRQRTYYRLSRRGVAELKSQLTSWQVGSAAVNQILGVKS